jgi:DNA polymerase-1
VLKDNSLYLIDSSSFFEDTQEAFLGAPLIYSGNRDVTFLFGFLKALLTVRQELRINVWIILISKECFADVRENDLTEVLKFMEEMGMPVISSRNLPAIVICQRYAASATAIYSNNEAMLQFARQDLCVIRSNRRKSYEYFSSDMVQRKYGVLPEYMPTFLALTQGSKDTVITKNQAVRLIEVFGKLESIFSGLATFPSTGLRFKLTENEIIITKRYQNLRPRGSETDQQICSNRSYSILLDTVKNAEHLHSMGFHSLTRLLPLSSEVDRTIEVIQENSSPDIINNKDALSALSNRLQNTNVWAIDTESSNRDPRSATLFGIAFSSGNGWSGYVPLLDHDLRGISPQEALKMIATQLQDKTKRYIGHNIKYDYLLLRRNGVHLQSIHFDTMLAAFECYGDLEFLNLGFLSERFLGKSNPSFTEIFGKSESPWDIPVSKLAVHSASVVRHK